ncbi:hypothetical protein ACFQV2_18390 [Actinokineospora soli]|uniref:DUF1707 domain-containing protein n=1 Tax=Actinokineospora soli TaxID=1048753 RepID=A0ABW2TN18_9PSEU
MARSSAPHPPDRDAALRALVTRGVLTEAQLDAVRAALAGPGNPWPPRASGGPNWAATWAAR